MFRLFCLLIGYGFGLIQTAFFVGKLKGIDIRQHGSGNAGTTNTMRVLGRRYALLVFAGDCLKSVLAVLVCCLIFKNMFPEAKYVIKLYAAAGAIIGHNFPFYLKFKGGKGIACTAGLMFSFDPWFTLVGLVLYFGLFFALHYVSVSSLSVYPYILIMEVILGCNGYFIGYDGMPVGNGLLIEMYIITFFLGVLTTFMHRENIGRLIKHTEKKIYLSKKHTKEN